MKFRFFLFLFPEHNRNIAALMIEVLALWAAYFRSNYQLTYSPAITDKTAGNITNSFIVSILEREVILLH